MVRYPRQAWFRICAMLVLCNIFVLAIPQRARAQAAAGSATISVLNRAGDPISAVRDGNLVSLRFRLGRAVDAPVVATFALDKESRVVATCRIARNDQGCEAAAVLTLGWYWGDKEQPRPSRRLYARINGTPFAATEVQVTPRPVVLVHGFISSAATWSAYTAADGFLATEGLRGYAVGDGQAPGVMHTGDIAQPTRRTNSISENAAVLQQYIAGVKQQTGAEQVDLVTHSMGGLISRYYIDRLMGQRDVAQLLMLGPPQGGSECAALPTSLGFYLPAALELRPAYLRDVFNQQITRRHGVPFHQLAGTPIVESFKSPCTNVPSDSVVDRGSVAVVAAPIVELPHLHTSLHTSAQVFTTFVAPHLRTPPGAFPTEPDLVSPATDGEAAQFTQVRSGHLAPGASAELTVNLDQVAVAGFALFDPSRSLQVRVRGASGRVIDLTPAQHGFFVVDDPATLVHLGYGFQRPAPGPWEITLTTTPKTPPEGADYAITAKVVGGASLDAWVDELAPRLNQAVGITARLGQAGQPATDTTIKAVIRTPEGTVTEVTLSGSGAERKASWTPTQPGLYGVDVTAQGRTAEGMVVERSRFLAFEVQPSPGVGYRSLAALVAGTVLLVGGVGRRIARRRRRRRTLAKNEAIMSSHTL